MAEIEGFLVTLHLMLLQQDVVDTLKNAAQPLYLDELVEKVTLLGYKKQINYVDDEIIDVLSDLLLMDLVKKSNQNMYEWRREI